MPDSFQANVPFRDTGGERMMSPGPGQSSLQGPTSGLLLCSPHADPVSSLERCIDAVRQGDPLAPVTVVGPSSYANLTLRRALARWLLRREPKVEFEILQQ